MRTIRLVKRSIIQLISWCNIGLCLGIWRFSQHRKAYLLVADIDNTLADTWPTLVERIEKDRDRFLNLNPLPGMSDYLENKRAQHHRVVFLSVRPLRHYIITKKWLTKHGFFQKDDMLILVSKVSQKTLFLRYFRKTCPNITYIDDLSYNQEKGDIKRYDQVIGVVEKLGITYIGLEGIEKIITQDAAKSDR